jgi:hypothetical protein
MVATRPNELRIEDNVGGHCPRQSLVNPAILAPATNDFTSDNSVEPTSKLHVIANATEISPLDRTAALLADEGYDH